jgi:hypothetical protein
MELMKRSDRQLTIAGNHKDEDIKQMLNRDFATAAVIMMSQS